MKDKVNKIIATLSINVSPLTNPFFFGRIAKSYLFDTNRIWRSSEEKIRKYQDKKFRQIVKYAYTVPLYHDKYKKVGVHPSDIRGIKDIKKLPMVSKKDFRGKNADVLLPPGADVNKHYMTTTSGSTGQPVTFYNDLYTIFHSLIGFIRILRAHDLSWRKNRLATIADLSPDSIENAFFSSGIPNLRTVISLNNMKVFHLGKKPEKLIDEINNFKPDFLGGYPGILNILATLKRQGKARQLEPRVIVTTGAVVDDYNREYIEKSFNSKLFDMYGATECSPMAFQCKNGNYHINSDFVYMEFMDPKEKEEISGDGGNVIITRLYGHGTPIIRYTGISDFVTPSRKKDDCGINTTILGEIGGRKVDSIVLPNGEIIPPFTLTGIPHKVMHQLNTEKVQQFQIIQQSLNKIDILIVIDENLRNVGPKVEEIFEEMKKQFEKKIGLKVKINVKEVDNIMLIRSDSAGAFPVVISRVNRYSKAK